MRVLLLLAAVTLACPPASLAAQPLGRDIVVCRTRASAEEGLIAQRAKDRRHADALLQADECHYVAGEHEYAVIRRHPEDGLAEIRVFVGRTRSFRAWVPLSALR